LGGNQEAKMNREELKKYVGTTAFSLGHVEKDYIQHIVLGSLSRNWSGYLVFKGGTALQKIGLVNRFSEVMDFTEKKDILPEKLADAVVKPSNLITILSRSMNILTKR